MRIKDEEEATVCDAKAIANHRHALRRAMNGRIWLHRCSSFEINSSSTCNRPEWECR